MYIGREFDPADPGEDQVYGFDFVNDMLTGDVINRAVVSFTVQTGVDGSPSSHLVGMPIITPPTVVAQRVENLIAGVTYILQIVATTQQGDTLSLYSRIPARPVY